MQLKICSLFCNSFKKGELPLAAQVRLLRVLQEKEIERVGGSKTIAVNCRVIAATHRNLEEMVRAGQFREDLWFRLCVFPIRIPPLRERASDIPKSCREPKAKSTVPVAQQNCWGSMPIPSGIE